MKVEDSSSLMRGVPSSRFIDALCHAGFTVYRHDHAGTILERDIRAVAVPNIEYLAPPVVSALRRMAGLTARELALLLDADARTETAEASTAARLGSLALSSPASSAGPQKARA